MNSSLKSSLGIALSVWRVRKGSYSHDRTCRNANSYCELEAEAFGRHTTV